ncbi:MAG TPA: type VI secretion system protein TssA [Burkholderiaceae bacterium]|nr:type VI secretion system protein TssA [Burkholderiaceae bacterium]
MQTLDVESLVTPLGGEAPCGDNLEYDPQFGELERALQGKAEVQYGATLVAAEPPDWKLAKSRAIDLLARTRDLRIGVSLAQALLRTDGVAGFSDGLAVVAGLLQNLWDQVHPQLDPDDGNDPTMRVNAIAALCDAETTLRGLRETPLVSSRVHGRFSLRDLEVAAGDVPPPADSKPPEMSVIDGAFMDAPLEEVQQVLAALDGALAHTAAIEGVVMARVGAAQAIDLSALHKLLARARALVVERLGRRPDAAAAVAANEATAGAGPAAAGAARRSLDGEINSRDDVVRTLERICDYYRREEPSSPVPLLLQRAKRLVPLNFYEIMADLAPDGLSQAEKILGVNGQGSDAR